VTLFRWVQRFTPRLIDVYLSTRRDIAAARRFFTKTLKAHGEPEEVVTGLAPALGHVIEGVLPDAFHNTDKYAKALLH
jgi:IS6 family transposase